MLVQKLRADFYELCEGYKNYEIVFNELDKDYSKDGRFYHNWSHINHSLFVLNKVIHIVENPFEVAFSLYQHDRIYDILAKDNEKKSAEIAYKDAIIIGVNEESSKNIYSQVIVTDHITEPSSIDEEIITDIDKSILGSPLPEYLIYSKGIMSEYLYNGDITKEEYLEGRINFLDGFLHKPIFTTKYFKENFEDNAVKNMEQEIKQLEEVMKNARP